MGKIFGLDYGRVRVGLASCSRMLKIPTPFTTFKMLENAEKSALALSQLLKKEGCDLLVIGLPLELSGKSGIMAEETKAFALKLASHLSEVKMHYLDERLTSAQAEKAMLGMDFSRKQRAKGSDTMAACLILETFLSMNPHL
jgi:putative Holliday junction resolvase